MTIEFTKAAAIEAAITDALDAEIARAATSRRTSPLRQLPAPHVAHSPNNLTGARPQTPCV